MLRRPFATAGLAAGLLTATGCICIDLPTFPRLRSLLPNGNGSCPPTVVYDQEGPILDIGESLPVSATPNGSPAVSESTMPQPRLVPQPRNAPIPQPMPYVPKD